MQATSNIIFFRFSPENMSEETLRQLLTGREEFLEKQISELKKSDDNHTPRYILIVGPRGIGKSHIMTLLYYEITKQLSNQLTPIKFAEEEYSIFRASDFFLRALEELKSNTDEIRKLKDEKSILNAAVEQLKYRAENENRQYIFLIENLHMIFRQLDTEELQELRSIFQKNTIFSIIASTPIIFEGIYDHDEPFYNFFDIKTLDELNIEETKELIKKIAVLENNNKFIEEFGVYENKIEGIYHLSGGSPRLIILLYEIITRGDFENLEKIFLKMMDEHTPYYQEIFEMIPAQRRLILDTIMTSPTPLTPKDIAYSSRLDVKIVNQQLRRLEKDRYLLSYPMKKRTSYEVRERLFRLWREMRKPLGKKRISIFIDFLTCWYTPEEREEKFKTTFELLSAGDKSLIKEVFYFAESLPPECRVRHLHNYVEKLTKLGATCEVLTTIKHLKSCIDQIQDENLKSSIFNEDGKLLSSKKEYEKALLAFDEALKHNPNNIELLQRKSNVLRILSRHDEALDTIDLALDIKPNNVSTLNIKTSILGLLNKYEEALETSNKAISIDSKNSEAYYLKEIALAVLKRYEEALETSDKATCIDPKNSLAYYFKAIILENLKRYEEALETINKALSIDPNNLEFFEEKSRILRNLSRYDEALDTIDLVLDTKPNNVSALNIKTSILGLLNKYEEALETSNKAISIDLKNSQAYYFKGLSLYYLEKYEESLKLFNKSLKIDPNDINTLESKGEVLYLLGKYKEVIKICDIILDLKQNDQEALYLKAESFNHLGFYDQSLELFNKLLLIYPNVSYYYYSKSYVLGQLERFEEAMQTIDDGLIKFPDDVLLLHEKDIIYFDLDQIEKSLEIVNKILRLEPNNSSALRRRAFILSDFGQQKEALESINKSLEIEPEKAISMFIKSVILSNQENYSEALYWIEKAIENDLSLIYINRKIRYLLELEKFEEVINIVKNTQAFDDHNDFSNEFSIALIEAYIKQGKNSKALIEIEKLKDTIKNSDDSDIMRFSENLFELASSEFKSGNHENGKKLLRNIYQIEGQCPDKDLDIKALTINFLKELIDYGDVHIIESTIDQIISCKEDKYRWFIKPLTDAIEIIKTKDVRIYYRDLQVEEREVVAEIVKKITKNEDLMPQNFI